MQSKLIHVRWFSTSQFSFVVYSIRLRIVIDAIGDALGDEYKKIKQHITSI